MITASDVSKKPGAVQGQRREGRESALLVLPTCRRDEGESSRRDEHLKEAMHGHRSMLAELRRQPA